MAKKVIKINEDSFNRLFNNNPVNEISYGTVDNASNKSDDIFTEMRWAFNEFYDTVKYNADVNNPYVQEIMAYANAIQDILINKTNQRDNFNNELGKFDYKKFHDEGGDDYKGEDLRTLQTKYPKER